MKMRILLVVPRFNIGGAETYVMTLALALQKQGMEVHIASGGGKLAGIVQDYGIEHHFVPVRLHAGLAAAMLARFVTEYRIDLIHANSAAAGIAAVKVKEKLSVPVVYTAHGVFGHNEAEMTLERCDKIICVSDFVRRDAMRRGFSEHKLQTVYTGIDLHKFKPSQAAREKWRTQLSIPPEAFTIAVTARIKNLRDKGHRDILRVLKEFEKAKEWHVLIIGKGKSLWRLKWLIRQWKLADRAHCLGHQLDVSGALNAADAVALPSKFETFGLVIAEGMAMEKAAVAYAVGGTPEVIEHGRTGYLAKAGDVGALFEKLSLLAEDKALCAALGKEGRRHVAQRFSCERMMGELSEIYAEACGKNCRD